VVAETMIIAQAATNANPGQSPALTIALAVLGSSVVAGLIGTMLGNTAPTPPPAATATHRLYEPSSPGPITHTASTSAPATSPPPSPPWRTLQEQLAESRA